MFHRVKRTPQSLVDTHITSTTGQRRRVSCDEDLRRIYYEVIDIIMGELDVRFQPEVEKISEIFKSYLYNGPLKIYLANKEFLESTPMNTGFVTCMMPNHSSWEMLIETLQ